MLQKQEDMISNFYLQFTTKKKKKTSIYNANQEHASLFSIKVILIFLWLGNFYIESTN